MDNRICFPFTAAVGQNDVREALLLNLIDPSIGGVLIDGECGSGKSTLARSIAPLCAGPFVEAPLSVSEDRLCGAADLEMTMLTMLLVYTISKLTNHATKTLILAGVAIGYLFSALVSALKYISNVQALPELVFWSMGSLAGLKWNVVLFLLIAFSVCFVLTMINGWNLNVMGGLAGWIASIIMKKNASMGVLANILVGIVGAFIGGLLMSLVGGLGVTGFNLQSFLVALLGSVVLLAAINLVKHGKMRSSH